MEEAVGAAHVDEGAEGHDLADDALDLVTLFEGVLELRGEFLLLGGDDVAPGEGDVSSSGAVDACDLAGEFLADEGGEVFDASDVDLAGGHEGAVVGDFEFEAALVDAGDDGLDDLALFEEFPIGLLDRAGHGADVDGLGGLEALDDDFKRTPCFRDLFFFEYGFGEDAEFLGSELDEDVLWSDGDDGAGAVFASALYDSWASDRFGLGVLLSGSACGFDFSVAERCLFGCCMHCSIHGGVCLGADFIDLWRWVVGVGGQLRVALGREDILGPGLVSGGLGRLRGSAHGFLNR